ncbi:hypothetical protein [Bacillus massilinigeriensis]|uniref:hypothetical protein n=1 Tax=Bacillus massilionigeriensis TaxID=1805475 RepID=UPI001356530E|nr:hypothetical protein [Bacillus massilionigeriensis]
MKIDNKKNKIQNKYSEIMRQKGEEIEHTKKILTVVIFLIIIIILFSIIDYNPSHIM